MSRRRAAARRAGFLRRGVSITVSEPSLDEETRDVGDLPEEGCVCVREDGQGRATLAVLSGSGNRRFWAVMTDCSPWKFPFSMAAVPRRWPSRQGRSS
jgi:hypothetical protein